MWLIKWSECRQFRNNYGQLLYPKCRVWAKWLLVVFLWLSAGQLEQLFRFSGTCFGCSGQTDNKNFKHWCFILTLSKCSLDLNNSWGEGVYIENSRLVVLNYISWRATGSSKIYARWQNEHHFLSFSYFYVFQRWSKGQTTLVGRPDLAHRPPVEIPCTRSLPEQREEGTRIYSGASQKPCNTV